jgi:hypothetical protein
MTIHQWLKETVWPALKNAWNKSREKSRKKTASRIFPNNDLSNPLHPFNMEQRAMEDYNDRRAQEALYDHLQDTQRFEEHQRHEHNYWDHYHR